MQGRGDGELDRDRKGSPPTRGPARRRRGAQCWRRAEGSEPDQVANETLRSSGLAASDLGAQDQKLLRAVSCEFGVGAALASLRDLQRGSVHLNGARMRVTRSFFFSRAVLTANNVSTQVLVPMRPTL